MSFNLNDKSFDGSVAIFNNGIAGKVNNVKVTVTKKTAVDADNAPDYKVVFSDTIGDVNVGFYYPVANPLYDEKRNKDLEGWTIGRVLSIAKSVLPNDFVFDTYNTSKEALDGLFTLIRQNSEGKTVNVFVTYGTTQKPSKYLGVRYFDFVESSDTAISRLAKKPADLLERVEADAPSTATTSTDSNW
jgi:hypothetical protein